MDELPYTGPSMDDLKKPKRKSPAKPVPTALEFHFRDDVADSKRVWRNDWVGDMFEIIDYKSFSRFRTMLKRFNVAVVDKNGDD